MINDRPPRRLNTAKIAVANPPSLPPTTLAYFYKLILLKLWPAATSIAEERPLRGLALPLAALVHVREDLLFLGTFARRPASPKVVKLFA